MLVSILMVVTGIACALILAELVQSTVRPGRDVRLPELRLDARARTSNRLGSLEHRRQLAYRRRRQLKRPVAGRTSATR